MTVELQEQIARVASQLEEASREMYDRITTSSLRKAADKRVYERAAKLHRLAMELFELTK